MKASQREPDCDRVKLDVLLFGDETSAEFRASQQHVETCPQCQDRLARTAADDGEWDEVRSVLQPDGEELPGGTAQRRRGPLKLDFLSAPSHPEMLGQLGRYQIEQVIGTGGMGIVLKGFDTNLNRPVAIKVLVPHLAHSGVARQRFAREARAAAAVVHEHVVAIYNVESEEETPFLVMQYVPGRSLQDRVELEGPLAPEEILRIGMQAAAGLAAAHAQGVIHRDVKPANILLENGVERALLTDFGLARAADDASLTHSGIVAGTPHYMSPEQARGDSAEARSDLFSLWAVLYFMATGHPPFRAEQAMAVLNRICHDRPRPVAEINPQIPDELADVIERLLEKKPSRRFASAEDVQQSLAGVLKGLQAPRRWRRRRWVRRLTRRRVLLSAACVAVAVAGMVWSSKVFVRPLERTVVTDGPDLGELSRVAAAEPALSHPTNPMRDDGFPSAETVALEIATRRAEFMNELVAIDQGIQQLLSNPYPEVVAVQSSRDSWTSELAAAKSHVMHLEESWPVQAVDRSSPPLPKGANP
jgi:eukaryotic-like serine/threonine-protein kinase